MTYTEFQAYYLANCSAVVVSFAEIMAAYENYLYGENIKKKEWTA